MDLAFSERQETLRAEAASFLQDASERWDVRELEAADPGYSPELWKTMGQRGWLGLLFPKAYGGTDEGFQVLAVLLEELGRRPMPTPYQTGIVQSGLAHLELADETQLARYLPPMATGALRFSFCLTEPSGSHEPSAVETRAEAHGAGYSLSGTKRFIQYAASADAYLVVARTPLLTIGGDRQCQIEFDQVDVAAENLVGPLHGGLPALRKVLALATIAQSAEMVGGARAALDYAVDYARTRVQFGRPIGSFQAIQHHAADMLIDCDAARLSVQEAASRVDSGLPFEMEASAAKTVASESYLRVTAKGHQILGGIGFYDELDMQLWFRRAKAMEQLLGDADFHRERVARLMGL